MCSIRLTLNKKGEGKKTQVVHKVPPGAYMHMQRKQ